MSVIIETSIGDITVDLFTDERPRCCMNFLKLCKIKYYNFSLFHSVQKDLVAQTGDPTAKGRGGESVFGFLYGDLARFFEMEVVPRILHTRKGLLSMVNNGSGMHGSQFFITLADNVDYLNNKHTVFGEVAEGMEIVDKLNGAFCDEDNRPHQDIRIYHTIILDDPYDDPDGLVVPSKSPPPTQEMLDSDRIPCDADIYDEDSLTVEQLAEVEAEREAKANTQLLEMVGDLPDQEVAPPENVLFVCKLNPVTTSDDLEIIFSRFGNVVSCEVIKDQKTGESLQYAFVEFAKEQDCESAYFKMDNVLIDDRRIHVDFSQSVSKFKWKGKGKGVEIMPDGDVPKFVLKNQERESHGYDLVYADEGLDEVSHKKHKHKKDKISKERKNKSSPSRDEKNPSHHKKKKDRSRERDEFASGDRSRERNRKERDRSRENEYRREKEDRDKNRRRKEPELNYRETKRQDSDPDSGNDWSRKEKKRRKEKADRRENSPEHEVYKKEKRNKYYDRDDGKRHSSPRRENTYYSSDDDDRIKEKKKKRTGYEDDYSRRKEKYRRN